MALGSMDLNPLLRCDFGKSPTLSGSSATFEMRGEYYLTEQWELKECLTQRV